MQLRGYLWNRTFQDTTVTCGVRVSVQSLSTGEAISDFDVCGRTHFRKAGWGFGAEGEYLLLRADLFAAARGRLVAWMNDSLVVHDLENGERVFARPAEGGFRKLEQRSEDVLITTKDYRLICFDPVACADKWACGMPDGRIVTVGDTILALSNDTLSVFVVSSADVSVPKRIWKSVAHASKAQEHYYDISYAQGHAVIRMAADRGSRGKSPGCWTILDLPSGEMVGAFRISVDLGDFALTRSFFYGLKPDGTVFRAPLEKLINPN